jgi:hypothetical protein
VRAEAVLLRTEADEVLAATREFLESGRLRLY